MSLDKGVTYTDKMDRKAPPRGEDKKNQIPKGMDKKVKGDGGRGSFTDKC